MPDGGDRRGGAARAGEEAAIKRGREREAVQRRTRGTIVSARKQWWLKINTKAFRTGPLDGAIFPYVVRVQYEVDGIGYCKRKWIAAGLPVPKVGEQVELVYDEEKPGKVKIVYGKD